MRASIACPFCGGAPSARTQSVVEGHYSRAHAMTLAGIGIAVAIDASACGAYGGPPMRQSPPATSSFEIEIAGDHEKALADFEARAVTAGCARISRGGAAALVKCAEGRVRVELRPGLPGRVQCESDEAVCRATYRRIMSAQAAP